ncbi:MAG: type II toxin-antitoxin system HicB family antitoxin [Waterburya sp.]
MSAGRIMSLDNYNFDGFIINLYVDEQEDWLAHFQELPNVSAFGDTPQEALEELKTAWELVKEDYREKHREIPIASNRLKVTN